MARDGSPRLVRSAPAQTLCLRAPAAPARVGAAPPATEKCAMQPVAQQAVAPTHPQAGTKFLLVRLGPHAVGQATACSTQCHCLFRRLSSILLREQGGGRPCLARADGDGQAMESGLAGTNVGTSPTFATRSCSRFHPPETGWADIYGSFRRRRPAAACSLPHTSASFRSSITPTPPEQNAQVRRTMPFAHPASVLLKRHVRLPVHLVLHPAARHRLGKGLVAGKGRGWSLSKRRRQRCRIGVAASNRPVWVVTWPGRGTGLRGT